MNIQQIVLFKDINLETFFMIMAQRKKENDFMNRFWTSERLVPIRAECCCCGRSWWLRKRETSTKRVVGGQVLTVSPQWHSRGGRLVPIVGQNEERLGHDCYFTHSSRFIPLRFSQEYKKDARSKGGGGDHEAFTTKEEAAAVAKIAGALRMEPMW